MAIRRKEGELKYINKVYPKPVVIFPGILSNPKLLLETALRWGGIPIKWRGNEEEGWILT